MDILQLDVSWLFDDFEGGSKDYAAYDEHLWTGSVVGLPPQLGGDLETLKQPQLSWRCLKEMSIPQQSAVL